MNTTQKALCLSILSLTAIVAMAQRAGPPRRIDDPQTIRLAGGSRVEFRAFSSPSLGGEGRYSIYFPPGYDESNRKFPVIYFLHGLNNDHTSWAVGRYGNLPLMLEERILEGKTPAVLMVHPDGDNSFYTDFADGSQKFEQFIYKDLRQEIEEKYRARTGRSDRAIAGTSMGGYGALKIALKHPGLYASAAAGSPIILLGEDPSQQINNSSSRQVSRRNQLLERIFGVPFDREHWKANNIEVLARSADPAGLRLYFSYGTADRYQNTFPMEEGIRTLHQVLTERGIPHVYRFYEGEGHGWDLIRDHLDEMLEFLTQTFE